MLVLVPQGRRMMCAASHQGNKTCADCSNCGKLKQMQQYNAKSTCCTVAASTSAEALQIVLKHLVTGSTADEENSKAKAKLAD